MGWETRKRGGRYYTRSKRVGGRVVREYVGSGRAGDVAERMDHQRRERLAQDRERLAAECQESDRPLAALEAFDVLVDQITTAVLTSAGYHRHHRDEWRKRRVHG